MLFDASIERSYPGGNFSHLALTLCTRRDAVVLGTVFIQVSRIGCNHIHRVVRQGNRTRDPIAVQASATSCPRPMRFTEKLRYRKAAVTRGKVRVPWESTVSRINAKKKEWPWKSREWSSDRPGFPSRCSSSNGNKQNVQWESLGVTLAPIRFFFCRQTSTRIALVYFRIKWWLLKWESRVGLKYQCSAVCNTCVKLIRSFLCNWL